MNGQLFTLCKTDDHEKIFAWGIEITDDDHTEAVIYRRDPRSGHPLFGLHGSAEGACRRYSVIMPLTVIWEEDYWDELIERTLRDDPAEESAPAHPRS